MDKKAEDKKWLLTPEEEELVTGGMRVVISLGQGPEEAESGTGGSVSRVRSLRADNSSPSGISESLSAAQEIIKEADMAAEATELAKVSVLQQAAQAMIKQSESNSRAKLGLPI